MKLTKILPKRSTVLLIVYTSLMECAVTTPTQLYDFRIPISILWSYGLLLFLAVIMLNFTKTVHQTSSLQPNKSTKLYTLLHCTILALLAIVCAALQGVWGFYYDHLGHDYEYELTSLVTTACKLDIAYNALFMLAAVYASIFLYLFLRKSRAHQPNSSFPLLPIVPSILAAAALVALVSRAYFYHFSEITLYAAFGARVALNALESLVPIVAFGVAIWAVRRAGEGGAKGGGGVSGGPYEQGGGSHGQPQYGQPQYAQP
jgi:uncharacterized membrane protein YgcG